MNENREAYRREHVVLNLMYGTYADILFILFPFLVISLQRLWNGEGMGILRQPDLSIAAAILAGMSIGKFVLGLITNRDLGQFKERIVFFIAVNIFAVLGPSMILIMKIIGAQEVPNFVVFIQPVLLILAISLYTTSVGISNILLGQRRQSEAEEDAQEEDDVAGGDTRAPLAIPKRLD